VLPKESYPLADFTGPIPPGKTNSFRLADHSDSTGNVIASVAAIAFHRTEPHL